MSRTQEINYPPEEIYKKSGFEKPNFEHVILWMLKNNKEVEWSNFKEDPINIAQSTLSNYMNSLMRKGYIEKIERGKYQITTKGEGRFNEISLSQETKRLLSYPPDVIGDSRNYEDIILWMAYNNNYLKWSDFLDDRAPIFINQSSLSKSINSLKDNSFIQKDDQTKEYRITNLGKSQYSRMLKLYDLDRQSILEEESKRIEEITKKTIRFFKRYGITDDDIKFRFLKYILSLPIEKLRGSIDNEGDFNKVLLFISMNHPNQYPFYISFEEFSKQFGIDQLDLEFNIRKIIDKSVYNIEFFKLNVESDKDYYFQAGEKLEKVLSAIVEDQVTKLTYLSKLYENVQENSLKLSLSSTINAILNEICDNLFDSGLRQSLRIFLPEYINYLAYKVETERKLVDTLDKLEGVAWRDIPEVFQSYSSRFEMVEQAQFKYSIDLNVLKVLNLFESPEIEKMIEDAKYMMKQKDFDMALDKVNTIIESDPNNLDLIFLKALVLSISNRHQEAIRFLKKEFKDHPNKNDEDLFIPINYLKVYCYMTLDRFDKALKISSKISEEYPDHPISYITKALIDGYKIIYRINDKKVKIDQVLDNIDQAISLDENNKNKAKYYYFKSYVLNHVNKFEEALEAIDNGLDLDPKDIKLHFMKYNILQDYGRIDEVLELIDEGIKLFPEMKTKLLTHKAYLYKKKTNYDKGLEIIDDLWQKYPKDLDLLNNKVYYHLYRGDKQGAIKAGKLLTELAPDDGNFHDSYGEVLTEFGEYEEALKILQKALDLDPLGWFTYNTYHQLARCHIKLGNYGLARETLDKGVHATETCFCGIKLREEWKEKKQKLLTEIEVLETSS
ncbi:MAG: tetratricopeptide repeat protein [Candidatus Hodarchaeota archaeon]